MILSGTVTQHVVCDVAGLCLCPYYSDDVFGSDKGRFALVILNTLVHITCANLALTLSFAFSDDVDDVNDRFLVSDSTPLHGHCPPIWWLMKVIVVGLCDL